MIRFIPNILTLARLGLTVVFLMMLVYSPLVPSPTVFLDMAFIVFVVAGLSDVVDGMVARRFNVASKFGRMIDPLVDKVLVCGAFVCLAWIGEPKLFDLPAWALAPFHWAVAAVLILREAYVTILRHRAEAHGINFAATASGKIKMFLQSFTIGAVVIKMAHVQTASWAYGFILITYLAMLASTVISGLLATQRKPLPRATVSV